MKYHVTVYMAIYFLIWILSLHTPLIAVELPQATVDKESSLEISPETSSLTDYLAYAALNNPGLEAAFHQWKAALERIPQARSLPDPRFTYRYFIKEVETRVGPQRQAFELAQMFPWFGKLDLAGDVAAQAAQAAYHKYEATKRKLFLEVKEAFYEFYYLERSIDVTQENMQLVQHLEKVVRIRYSTATAQHPDIIKIQVELGKLEDRLKTLQDLKAPMNARLNAALNRPAAAPLDIPTSIAIPPISLDEATLFERLDQTHPDLLALNATVTQYNLATDLAKKDYSPNVTLGMSYVDVDKAPYGANPPDNGQDIVGVMASINIPLWQGRISAKVRENKLRELATRKQKLDLTNQFHARLKLALYQTRDARRKQNLYGDTLLPKAEESLKATETAFRSSTGTFLDLIDAQRVYLEFQLAYERAIADTGKGLAHVEMLVGELSAKNKEPQDEVYRSDP
jgi:outer membrane protein TolC